MIRRARALAFALVVAASGRAAAEPPAAPAAERYVAGKLLSEDNLVIEQVGADGKAVEVFRGGAPTSWHWFDAHTLVELFDDGARGDAVIAWIVDGKPVPARSIKLDNTAWPAEAQGWSQYLAVHQGQLWLVREPGRSETPGRSDKTARGARTRGKAAKARPAAPVYQRIDVKPPVVQREPPAGGVAARDDGRAWLDRLPSLAAPSLAAPATIKVTRARARLGKRSVGVVRCKPARGAMTTFPTATTHPFLRIDVDAVRFVSPTLPLYVASGIAARPDGPAFDTAAFLGCTKEPLHTLVWAGGDVFLTIAGAPGGAGFSPGDHRTMQLWVDGRTVADLGVLLGPQLSPAGPAR